MSKQLVKEVKETPLMGQYNKIKATYPDALLLFRVGDFYETFGEDAKRAASILGIVLTRRANGTATYIELAGFPYHSLDTYLPKLVRAGLRVAICDQLEDAKNVKTIVKRGVTELVSPGVAYSSNILVQKSSNYLAAVYIEQQNTGIAFLDISTGEFMAAEGNSAYIDKLLQSFRPAEVLLRKADNAGWAEIYGARITPFLQDDWIFGHEYARETLLKHFEVNSLMGFGLEEKKLASTAAGACIHYIHEARHTRVPHISSISRIDEEQYVWLDRFTVRNLELVHPNSEGAVPLIDVLDQTVSPMGARLLKKWLILPLKEAAPINERLDRVQSFYDHRESACTLSDLIHSVGDLERLISRIALQKAGPRDLLHAGFALLTIGKILTLQQEFSGSSMQVLFSRLDPLVELQEKLLTTLSKEPPVLLSKGGVIAEGIDEELDELRKIAFSGKDYLLEIQKREALNTGISTLKINFNNVFGYYFEVTHANTPKVPAEWIRKQTLVNAERYISPELKIYEDKILGAEDKISVIESRIYVELLKYMLDYIRPIQLNAQLLAEIDVLLNYATISLANNYNRPSINSGRVLKIMAGRHAVIEKQLALGDKYVPNDLLLDPDNQQIMMITGPNMAGKSALLRQVALIVIMAQAGCFVPADSAEIGLVDKVFTRVGASDNLSAGQSTFMVEMNETASILNNLSDRSLVLLDEIGRGTSTYDGISIAWSVAEYLHEHARYRAKTLFATHYHELNDMEKQFDRIQNFNVSVKESNKKIIFLRKLVAGGIAHSFGIHVAKMAGMPAFVLSRAAEVLRELELQRATTPSEKTLPGGGTPADETFQGQADETFQGQADETFQGQADETFQGQADETLKGQAGAVAGFSKNSGLLPQLNTAKPIAGTVQLSMFSLDDPLLIKIRDSLKGLDVNTLTPIEALVKLHEMQEWFKL